MVGEAGISASCGWQAARISAMTSNKTGRAACLDLCKGLVFTVNNPFRIYSVLITLLNLKTPRPGL
jgi:hypothetical protein